MNVITTRLKARVVAELKKKPLKFSALCRRLRVRNQKVLDNVLQALRKSGQIHYTGHLHGWNPGKGFVFSPNQHFS